MQGSAGRQGIAFGVMLIVATALTISVQDLVFKLFSGSLTLWQIFALRGVIALPILFALFAVRGPVLPNVAQAFSRWPLLRAMCLTTTFLCFYAAIPFLSLSTVGAANYIAPIFVAVLSAYVIAEPVGRLGWIGVFLGFAGVVILLQPGTDAFSPFAVLPVIGAAFYAGGHIITRTRCQDVPVAALSLSLNTMMLLSAVLITAAMIGIGLPDYLAEETPYLFGPWAEVTPLDWVVLALLAGFAVAIGMMLAGAYQAAPPATVATFEYSYLVFAALWDILVFDQVPTALSVMGMLMIVAAGLLVIRGRV